MITYIADLLLISGAVAAGITALSCRGAWRS